MRLDTTRSQTTAENSGVPVTLLPLGGKDPPHEFELPLEHLCRDEGEPLTVLAHEDKPLAGGETEMVARRFRDDDLATLVHRDGTPHVLALGGRWQYAAVIELLGFYGYDLTGARATVVGRSLVIGKPVSMMLQAKNATVTMCHTRTKDLAAECAKAEILVVAAGHIGTAGAASVAPGQVVIDVGINWDEKNNKLAGDVLYDEVAPIVDAITPVPGGVGSVTTAILAKHVIEAAERRA